MVSWPRSRMVSQVAYCCALIVWDHEREGFVEIRIREEDLSRPVRRHDNARHHQIAIPLRELLRHPLAIDGHEGEADTHLTRQAVREFDIEAHEIAR